MWYFKLHVSIPCFDKPCLKLLICEEVKGKGRLRRKSHNVYTWFFCSAMLYPHSYVSEDCEKTHIFFAKIAMPAKKKKTTNKQTKNMWTELCWQRRALNRLTSGSLEKLHNYVGRKTSSASKEKDPAATAKPVLIYINNIDICA